MQILLIKNIFIRVSLNSGSQGLLWTGPEDGIEESGPVDLPPGAEQPDSTDFLYDVSSLVHCLHFTVGQRQQ